MKFLITGVTGFVGNALAKELLLRGHSVRGALRIDRKIPSGVESVIVGELTEHTDWILALRGVDVVIHLAARVHVMDETSSASNKKFFTTNLEGTQNLVRQAVKTGVKRFIFVSSVKVNGEYTEIGQAFDEATLVNPTDAYSLSKWEAEKVLKLETDNTELDYVIVRPPLIYGPNVKANFFKLIKLVNSGIPIPLGNVKNKRSLIYLGNFVDALILCATHPAAGGNTYLVSDIERVSTPELIKKIANSLVRSSRLFPIPFFLMYFLVKLIGKTLVLDRLVKSLEIDNSKIRIQLGWIPPYTLDKGLEETANWFKDSVFLVKK